MTATKAHNVNLIVYNQLAVHEELRDDHQALVLSIWKLQNPSLSKSIEKLEALNKEGKLHNAETIRRASRRLQERNEYLRGEKWEENRAHDCMPTLFSLLAKPVLELLANHQDLKRVCYQEHTEIEWQGKDGKIWAKEKNGTVYFPKRELERVGFRKYVEAYLSTNYSEKRARVTRNREEAPTNCYQIPVDDILIYSADEVA